MDDFVSLLTSIFLNQLRTNELKINCSSIFLLRLKYLHPKGFLEYFVPGFISSSLLQRQIIPILRPTSIVSSHPFRCKGSWKRFSMRSKRNIWWRGDRCFVRKVMNGPDIPNKSLAPFHLNRFESSLHHLCHLLNEVNITRKSTDLGFGWFCCINMKSTYGVIYVIFNPFGISENMTFDIIFLIQHRACSPVTVTSFKYQDNELIPELVQSQRI